MVPEATEKGHFYLYLTVLKILLFDVSKPISPKIFNTEGQNWHHFKEKDFVFKSYRIFFYFDLFAMFVFQITFGKSLIKNNDSII